jgi:hypothetical protein
MASSVVCRSRPDRARLRRAGVRLVVTGGLLALVARPGFGAHAHHAVRYPLPPTPLAQAHRSVRGSRALPTHPVADLQGPLDHERGPARCPAVARDTVLIPNLEKRISRGTREHKRNHRGGGSTASFDYSPALIEGTAGGNAGTERKRWVRQYNWSEKRGSETTEGWFRSEFPLDMQARTGVSARSGAWRRPRDGANGLKALFPKGRFLLPQFLSSDPAQRKGSARGTTW